MIFVVSFFYLLRIKMVKIVIKCFMEKFVMILLFLGKNVGLFLRRFF